MTGRLLITVAVLTLAVAACADQDVVGGDDVVQESESGTDETPLSHESTSEEPAGVDPLSVSSPTSQESTNEEPLIDTPDQTTSTTVDDSPLVTNPPKEIPSTTTTSEPSEDNPGIDPGLSPLVDRAKGDLAGRLGIDAGAIVVVSAELVEWSDASLGCPQPGMVYAQVPTDGSLIVLSHGGAEYRYHTGGSKSVPFLCE